MSDLRVHHSSKYKVTTYSIGIYILSVDKYI